MPQSRKTWCSCKAKRRRFGQFEFGQIICEFKAANPNHTAIVMSVRTIREISRVYQEHPADDLDLVWHWNLLQFYCDNTQLNELRCATSTTRKVKFFLTRNAFCSIVLAYWVASFPRTWKLRALLPLRWIRIFILWEIISDPLYEYRKTTEKTFTLSEAKYHSKVKKFISNQSNIPGVMYGYPLESCYKYINVRIIIALHKNHLLIGIYTEI